MDVEEIELKYVNFQKGLEDAFQEIKNIKEGKAKEVTLGEFLNEI